MQRVVAYCRVSTDKGQQMQSLESQKRYFTQYIMQNQGWQLGEVYVDEGRSGTSTKKRAAFNQMIADGQAGCFDFILTKEISRFARNTLDSIYYTRKLKALGIGVIFLNDGINTMDADAELRLTILSSIAQEESRKTSDRVKWGQKRRMEQGVVFGREMLGYHVTQGKLSVCESGAQTVQLIFHKFLLEGKGAHRIARELKEAEIPTSTYMQQWSNTTILRILRNEKYCGDLVQKKTITPNYLDHQKQYNKGEEALVVLRDHHQPIVSRAVFEAAQQELARRAQTEACKRKQGSKYCFSGKMKCGLCGHSYVPREKMRKDGSVHRTWRCYEAARHGKQLGCSSLTIGEEVIQGLMQQVLQDLQIGSTVVEKTVRLLQELQENKHTCPQVHLQRVKEKRQNLLALYLEEALTKQEYQHMVQRLEVQEQQLQPPTTPAPSLQVQKEQMQALLQGQQWSDSFYRHIIDAIVIDPQGIAIIHCKCLPQPLRYARCP